MKRRHDIRISKTSGNVPVPFFAAKRVDFAVQWNPLMAFLVQAQSRRIHTLACKIGKTKSRPCSVKRAFNVQPAGRRERLASRTVTGEGLGMRTQATAVGLLGRVLEPLGRCLTPACAREILSLQADQAAIRRVEHLASKCDAGTLTPEERAEYQLFVEVGDLVALLQAKARRYLAEHSGA